MAFPPQTIDYYGERGVSMENPGVCQTDRYGVSSCTARFRCPVGNWTSLPKINSTHPIFTGLRSTGRELALKGTWAYADMLYEGGDPMGGGDTPDSEAIYELTRGLSEDPIETHPDFVSQIGGKPTAPLNGAIFYNPSTGARTDGSTAADTDDGWVFDSFALILPSGPNDLAKLEAYLAPSKVTWRKTWISHSSPSSAQRAGKIDSPPGGAPSVDGNWLNMGITSVRRGSVYQNSEEWMASARKGWLRLVYS